MLSHAKLTIDSTGYIKANKSMAIGTDPNYFTALNVYKMGNTSSDPTYGIKTKVKMPDYPIYPLYGIYAEADAHTSTHMNYPCPIVGLYGVAKKNGDISTFSAGVVGIGHWRGGVGVFGGINNPITSLPSNALYAGYFNGATKVNGTLQAKVIVINGDTIQLSNIQSLQREYSEVIRSLHPVTYIIKSDSAWQYDEQTQHEMRRVHMGFVAQEVQKILPELVYERDGNLSINYIEMIPLLLQEIQRLSNEVEELKRTYVKRVLKSEQSTSRDIEAVLYQNTPNPFSVETRIAYLLPQTTQSATLYIYNMNGLQVAEYPISSFGEGSVVVEGGRLEPGMYLYSLVADGQVIDTKRMILTK